MIAHEPLKAFIVDFGIGSRVEELSTAKFFVVDQQENLDGHRARHWKATCVVKRALFSCTGCSPVVLAVGCLPRDNIRQWLAVRDFRKTSRRAESNAMVLIHRWQHDDLLLECCVFDADTHRRKT